VLAQVVADPTVRIGSVDLLTAAERAEVLALGRGAPAGRSLSEQDAIHALIEQRAADSPDAIAVASARTALTYGALDRRANQLARLVRTRWGAIERLGILCDRSQDRIVALLASMKAGAAYLPLDPDNPDRRLKLMIEDARPQVILAHSRFASRVAAGGVPIVYLDGLETELDEDAVRRPNALTTPDDPIYVLYTSGSTGTPKGIAMPHRAIANLLAWYSSALPDARRTLQYASLSFDMASLEILTALTGGGTVVLVDEDVRRDTTALAAAIRAYGIDTLMLPVSVADHLARALSLDAATSPVRHIVTAGEQLTITAPLVALATRTECVLHNFYGPSETHVVTAHDLSGPAMMWPTRPPIGRPIGATSVYVVDPAGRPAPVGIPGELWVGGTSLALGYWQQHGLTATRFVADPFSSVPGARVYRTGDIARWQTDGTLEFLGRGDDQVKIRGFRVELGEVEAVLAESPDVDHAVIVVRDDESSSRRLAAYVVSPTATAETPHAIRAFLATRLPDYMIPSWIEVVPELPLTVHGKVNRTALRVPQVVRPRAYVGPRTPSEALLAYMWADLLQVPRIGVHDNFFELGGHSLLAMQVVSRMSECFLRPINVRVLFEQPTVQGIRQYLWKHERFAGETEDIAEAVTRSMGELNH
jgi:amino acid adenylation domain-containing protein